MKLMQQRSVSRRAESWGCMKNSSAHKGVLLVALTAACVLEAHVMLDVFLCLFHLWDDQKTTFLREETV